MVKKALKRLYFLKKLGKFLCQVLVNLYTGEIESILTGNLFGMGCSGPRSSGRWRCVMSIHDRFSGMFT